MAHHLRTWFVQQENANENKPEPEPETTGGIKGLLNQAGESIHNLADTVRATASFGKAPLDDEARLRDAQELERSRAAEEADFKAGHIIDYTGNREAETRTGITGMLQNAGDALRKGVEDLTQNVRDTADKAEVYTHEPLSHRVKTTAEEADRKLGEAAEQTGQKLQEAKECVSDSVQQTAEDTRGLADRVRSALSGEGSDAYAHEKASDKAARAAEHLDYKAGEAVDKTSDKLDEAQSSVSGMLQQAQDSLVRGAESVADAVKSTLGVTDDARAHDKARIVTAEEEARRDENMERILMDEPA